MASHSVSLGRRQRRRWRRDLIHFFQSLGMYATAGFDLAYAWPQSLEALKASLDDALHQQLMVAGDVSLASHLNYLADGYPDATHRAWFGVLADLYAQGASVGDSIGAIADVLRSEQKRDLESFLSSLPTRLNLLILVFFLPPTLLLLFLPLLAALN